MKKYIKCRIKRRTNKEKLNTMNAWNDIPEFNGRRWVSGNEFWEVISRYLGISYMPTREFDIRGYDLTLPPFNKGS